MTTLSLIRATECTFWASWEVPATPELLAVIGARPVDEVAGPLPVCGPARVDVNGKTLAVTLYVERLAERAFAVIYQVQKVELPADEGDEAGRLFEVLRGIVGGAAVTADLKIDVTLPSSLVWCPGFPRRPDAMGSGIDAAALELTASTVAVERVGYRFVDGIGGLEEVELVYMHEEDEYTVEIRARGPFQVVAPALVPWSVEELANFVLGKFFRARSAAA